MADITSFVNPVKEVLDEGVKIAELGLKNKELNIEKQNANTQEYEANTNRINAVKNTDKEQVTLNRHDAKEIFKESSENAKEYAKNIKHNRIALADAVTAQYEPAKSRVVMDEIGKKMLKNSDIAYVEKISKLAGERVEEMSESIQSKLLKKYPSLVMSNHNYATPLRAQSWMTLWNEKLNNPNVNLDKLAVFVKDNMEVSILSDEQQKQMVNDISQKRDATIVAFNPYFRQPAIDQTFKVFNNSTVYFAIDKNEVKGCDVEFKHFVKDVLIPRIYDDYKYKTDMWNLKNESLKELDKHPEFRAYENDFDRQEAMIDTKRQQIDLNTGIALRDLLVAGKFTAEEKEAVFNMFSEDLLTKCERFYVVGEMDMKDPDRTVPDIQDMYPDLQLDNYFDLTAIMEKTNEQRDVKTREKDMDISDFL